MSKSESTVVEGACASVVSFTDSGESLTPLSVVHEKSKKKDAERKRKWRKHNHLQMKVDKNPVSDNYDGHNGKRKK